MNKYINRFIKLTCAPDLLALKLFPNAKEICETYACRDATYRFFGTEIRYKDNLPCFVIGDGHKPRTGAFFAYTTACDVWSIDPALRIEGKYEGIKKLICVKKKVEKTFYSGDSAIVVFPHAHAPINHVLSNWDFNKLFIVSMPCCLENYQILPNRIGLHYRDMQIPSPKNHIFGWRVERGVK